EVRSEETVDRQPALADEIADSAAERQPSDADGGRVAETDRETVRGGRLRDPAGREARLCNGDVRVWVDCKRIHLAEIEHEAAVGDAVPGEAMTAAANGQLDVVLAREPHDRGDVRVVDRTYDCSGTTVEALEEHRAGRVVRRLVGADHLAGQFQPQAPKVEPRLRSRAHERSPFGSPITQTASP